MKQQLTYQDGTSLLHQLHPLIKLAWLVVLTVLVFVLQLPWFALPLVLLLVAIFPLLGINLLHLRGIRTLFATALLIGLLQIVFDRSSDVLLQIGPVGISTQGLLRGGYLAARFLAVIFLSYLFVLTTSPNHLAYALMRAGLPYRFGFTIVTALRMIPIFEQEALTVYRAQLVRGVSYNRGRISTLIRSFRILLLPMLISAINKVDALSISMEGRCFGRYPQRTYFRTWQTSPRDRLFGWMLLLLTVITIGLIIIMEV